MTIIVYGPRDTPIPAGAVSVLRRSRLEFKGKVQKGVTLCATDRPDIAKAYGDAGVDVQPFGDLEKEVRKAAKEAGATVKKTPAKSKLTAATRPAPDDGGK